MLVIKKIIIITYSCLCEELWGGGGTCQSIHSMAATIKFGDYCHMGMNQLAPFIGEYSIADGSTICHVKKCPTLCHPQT